VAPFKYVFGINGNTLKFDHSVQNLLPSHLSSKNVNIIMYETIILPVILNGCETWSLTLMEEQGAEERIFGPKRDKVTEG
jgi:hypothetical protein